MRKGRFAKGMYDSQTPLNAAVSARDRNVMTMVKEAVAHKQTMLAYQPIMVAQEPGRVGFYEGLIRIMDETGRIIPAREFMGSIETTELGRDIDVLSLGMGLEALHKHPELRLSINMSARSIGYERWMHTLKQWLRKDESVGARLILEITEGSAMDQPEVTANFMDRLSRKGICFALDDFGAGYTALRHFKDFLFDVLKIDGQFCHGIANDLDCEALVKAMVSIGRHFDMLIVAEGVERGEDAARLTDLGVDCLQGYFFGAPSIRPAWIFGEAPQKQATGSRA